MEMGVKNTSFDPMTKKMLRCLGINLLRLREARRWTQADIAARCGMRQQVYQQIEAGRVNTTIHTLAKLAACFGVDIAELVTPNR
jgi:putative transcriptional regulator